MSKRILFIDRDGTLINEAPDFQIDSFKKLVFYPHVFQFMRLIAVELDFELVMVTNQDGLGRPGFSEPDFWEVHEFIMTAFRNEDVEFAKVFLDKSFPYENSEMRKPGTGMLTHYLNNPDYDIDSSFVIGDRITDMQLAQNLGCKGIWINNDEQLGATEISSPLQSLNQHTIALATQYWKDIYEFLKKVNGATRAPFTF